FDEGYFDFVSCMMGTFFHIAHSEQPMALAEMLRVCRPGGVSAISTWDLECPHLTFLSMYSAVEKEMITRNANTLEDMCGLMRNAGFVNVQAVKLALVPDTISYDLGIEELDVDGLKRMLEIDIATRSAMPKKHGEMFIAFGEKGGATTKA